MMCALLRYGSSRLHSTSPPQHPVSKFNNFVLRITRMTNQPVSEVRCVHDDQS